MAVANEAPDFPVTWDDPADAETCWRHDREHLPFAVPPLHFDVNLCPFLEGFGFWNARPKYANYYMFFPMGAPSGSGGSSGPPPASVESLREAARRWHEEIVPEVVGYVDHYRTTDFDALSSEALASEVERLREVRHRSGELHTLAIMPGYTGMTFLIETYKELTGGDDLSALRLVQGYGNKSVEAGEGLWRLARLAETMPAVAGRLASVDGDSAMQCLADLEADPAAAPFLEAFRAYLDEFGWRDDFSAPTWAERPTVPLTMLRAYIEAKDYDHPAEQRRLAEERETALAETLAKLSPDDRKRLEDAQSAARGVAILSEDHNYYIDQRLQTMPRRLVLAAGRRLMSQGALADPNDVFHLHAAEITGSLRGNGAALSETAPRRKEELAYWRGITPPSYIGAPPPVGLDSGHSSTPREPERKGDLRGLGASSGVVRGPARIVPTLADSHRLRPGDILVTSVTQPPWTPLFAIARAVVTEVGGVLGHTAIVAREYGIPAVLAVPDAMRRLQDGALIEVDGAAGVVRVVA
ncbi:MAG: PEP-utilizing enzyme [Dehalococcoidia bacterium]